MQSTWPMTGFTSALRQVGAALATGSPSLAARAPAMPAVAARLAATASPLLLSPRSACVCSLDEGLIPQPNELARHKARRDLTKIFRKAWEPAKAPAGF